MSRRMEEVEHFFDRGVQQLKRYHDTDCGNHKQPFQLRESEKAPCKDDRNRNGKLDANALLR